MAQNEVSIIFEEDKRLGHLQSPQSKMPQRITLKCGDQEIQLHHHHQSINVLRFDRYTDFNMILLRHLGTYLYLLKQE